MLKNKLFQMIFVGCIGMSTLMFSASATESNYSSDISNAQVFQAYVDNQLQKLDLSSLPEERYKSVVDASKYAYIDLDSVDSAYMKDKIIESRNTIIFSQGWVADGLGGRIIDKYGNYEEVPEFHKLFPDDWEVPSFQQEDDDVDSVSTSKETRDWDTVFNKIVTLKIPSSITNSPEFYSIETSAFVGTSNEYNIKKLSTVGYNNMGNTYNLGYSNKKQMHLWDGEAI